MKCNEINLFYLLISSAFDSLLNYTIESLNDKRLIPLSHGRYASLVHCVHYICRAIMEHEGISHVKKHMGRENFIQILTTLHGYVARHRIIITYTSRWIDQCNAFDHLHVFEKKTYERNFEFSLILLIDA
jgi:hypothetical protein